MGNARYTLRALGYVTTMIASAVAGAALILGRDALPHHHAAISDADPGDPQGTVEHPSDPDPIPSDLTASLLENEGLDPYSPEHRFVFTRPSPACGQRYAAMGRLWAQDIVSGYKTLMEIEFRSYHLSTLEKKVARCILKNDSNHAIGEKLLLSESTVKYHVRNIYKKARCRNRNSFAHLIHDGVENSDHSWKSRRELERDMEYLQIQ